MAKYNSNGGHLQNRKYFRSFMTKGQRESRRSKGFFFPMYSSILYADEKGELCAAMNQGYIILEKLVEKIINWIFNYQDSALRNKSVYHLMGLLEKEGIKCFDVMEAYKPYTAGTAKKYEELQKMLGKNKPSEDTYVDLSGI